MTVTRRVSVILPDDRWCSARENAFKWAIVERIEALGLVAEIFHDPRGTASLCAPMAWSAANADFISRRCVGAALIGLPRWRFQSERGAVNLPTEFSHFEGALAWQLKLPLLVLAQSDVMRRVVFDNGFHGRIGEFPPDAGVEWLETRDFTTPFTVWQRELADRRDVFLGYCGASTATAKAIKRFLGEQGVTVLDWQTDFPPGQNILQQIGRAAERCSAGIFLFTRDDELAAVGSGEVAVPRDNVVFEAGYFIHAKGKDRVLVVREDGAKMPADLGGDIFAPLPDRNHIGPILDSLRRFAAAL
ncbi:MAG: nucleotide-binding protein [Burkholderiales bacterium]